MRFATVPRMATSPSAGLAPIRTKFALPCAFAALITLCTLATAAGARSAEPPVARAVFVTPAGDRAAAQRAVVAAGGIPEGWVGGRLKAALADRRAGGRARLARGRGRRARRDVVGRRDHLAGRRPERRRRAAARGARRQRRDDRRARPGLRRGQPAERAGGHASCRRSSASTGCRSTQTYGLAGRDYNGNSSRHGEFVTRDRLRHGAGRDLLVPQLPHARRVRPGRRLHRERAQAATSSCTRTRSCSGRFDGIGLVRAEGRRRRRRPGVLWVNSAGNYRTRHWEGAVERRRRRRQPRRAGRRQRVPRRAGGDHPPGLRHLLGRARRADPGELLHASRSTRTPR